MSNIRVFLGNSLKASVAVKRLLASYAYGIFRLIFSFADSFSASDSPAKTVQKPQQDSLSTSDSAQKAFTKPFSEDLGISETSVITFTKVADDSAGFSEALNFDVHLVKSESIGVTDDVDGEASALDDQTIQFIKVRQEVAFASDTLVRVATYNRTLTDDAASSEDIVLSFNKGASDSALIADVFIFQTGKGLLDQSSTVDQAILDLSKQLQDSSIASDQPALSLAKAPISDSALSSDDVSLEPNKVLSEQALTFDSIFSITFSKIASDSGSLIDDQTLIVSMPKADDVYMVDQPAKTLQKSLSDSASVADLFDSFVIAGLLTNNNGTATETIEFNISKPFSDAFSAQELVAFTLNRFIIDNGSAEDQQVKSLSKRLVDQSTSSDSGSLRGQGYCDFDYFSEDYVGYSRTFT